MPLICFNCSMFTDTLLLSIFIQLSFYLYFVHDVIIINKCILIIKLQSTNITLDADIVSLRLENMLWSLAKNYN